MNRKKYYPQELSCSIHKFFAFTLWDMLTAIVLTSLLISIVYMLLRKTQLMTSVDEDFHSQLEEVLMLEKKIYYAFINSGYILMDQDIMYFDYVDDHPLLELEDTICYYFPSENALPQAFPIESFKVSFVHPDQPVVNGLELIVKSKRSHSYSLVFSKYYNKKELYKMEKNGYGY